MSDFIYQLALETDCNFGRIKAASFVAGKLIGAWSFAYQVEGVVVARRPTHLEIFGLRSAIATQTPAPVSLLISEPWSPLLDYCGLQASAYIIDDFIESDDPSLRRARDIVEDYGGDDLEGLIRTLLSDRYLVAGVRDVPREHVPMPSAHVFPSSPPHETAQRPNPPARSRVKPNGASHDPQY
jgi:hypothetical protein